MGWINLSAIWKIVVFGLLAGAGLPALFAIGLRALVLPGSRVQTAGADSDHVYGGNVLGLVIAVICFLIILAGLSVAIYLRSRATKVDHNNVNDEWTGGTPSEPEPAAAA